MLVVLLLLTVTGKSNGREFVEVKLELSDWICVAV